MTVFLRELISNDVLWVSVFTSSLAQFLKPFTHWFKTGEFDWTHIAATGGMPSSHSALVSATALGVGLENGFDSAFFALAVALAMIVVYDAAGVRREAGEHGRAINLLIAKVLSGHPLNQERFEEVLGHSRKEVTVGVLFGLAIMASWKFLLQPLFIG